MFSSALEQAILEAVVYFELFSRPLTTFEIWKNLRTKAGYGEVVEALETSAWLKERLVRKDGMWSVKGGKDERAERYRISKYKLDIAKRFARWARFIPGLVGICACNTLGFLGSRAESDIDLLLVTQRGWIWTVRFFTVLLAKLFFRRPAGAHSKDAICLSFFAVEGADMRKVALPDDDVYYEFWLKNLLPLWKRKDPSPSGGAPPLGDGRWNILEQILRGVQWRILPARLKALANQSTSVVINDEFLKFHDHDRREYYREQFRQRLAAVSA